MKVVSVCSSDWSNFAYNFSESLRSVGIDSYSYCLAPHVFGYPKQSEVVALDQLRSLTSDADFIVVHHSCNELLPHLSDRKIIHYAAGTKYRQNPEGLNEAFKGAVKTFIALPEFQHTAKNFVYVVGAVDTDYLTPISTNAPYYPTFAHYPSNSDVKGTEIINRITNDLKVKYYHSVDKIDWQKQIDRMKRCDIYIELFAPTQGGKSYGSFGITCLEAAALGKVVITQNLTGEELYAKSYGDFEPIKIKDEAHLSETIKGIITISLFDLNNQKVRTRDWVVRNHSYKATGEYVKRILNDL